MSNEEAVDDFKIPRYGNAGVAFLGVELSDALILIVSVFVGLATGTQFGPVAYIGVPVAGFFLNKLFIDWRSKSLPGQTRVYLFQVGLVGYAGGFKGGDVVFVGDGVVINPDPNLLDDAAAALIASPSSVRLSQEPSVGAVGQGGRRAVQIASISPVAPLAPIASVAPTYAEA